jgi:hypothetical protein
VFKEVKAGCRITSHSDTMNRFATIAALATSALAGTTIWSGSFTQFSTVAAFDTWSWSNQVGSYQWYIHGSGSTYGPFTHTLFFGLIPCLILGRNILRWTRATRTQRRVRRMVCALLSTALRTGMARPWKERTSYRLPGIYYAYDAIMCREIIPQTTQNLGVGNLLYHFSKSGQHAPARGKI